MTVTRSSVRFTVSEGEAAKALLALKGGIKYSAQGSKAFNAKAPVAKSLDAKAAPTRPKRECAAYKPGMYYEED
jgi:hypothetical protein